MKTNDIVNLGTQLGLKFNTNSIGFQFGEGIVVFDGVNGQRFLIQSDWSDNKILNELGKSLILMGKRMKSIEIQQVISITNDYEY